MISGHLVPTLLEGQLSQTLQDLGLLGTLCSCLQKRLVGQGLPSRAPSHLAQGRKTLTPAFHSNLRLQENAKSLELGDALEGFHIGVHQLWMLP